MNLTLHDGSIVSFTDVELGQTLTRLISQNQSYCLGTQDTAHVRVGGSLLVMDIGWIQGRKLIEGYAISADTTFPFGIRFTLGQTHYTLSQALAGAGYVGTITELSQAFMALYNGGAQTYLEAGQLVKSQGLFSKQPGRVENNISRQWYYNYRRSQRDHAFGCCRHQCFGRRHSRKYNSNRREAGCAVCFCSIKHQQQRFGA